MMTPDEMRKKAEGLSSDDDDIIGTEIGETNAEVTMVRLEAASRRWEAWEQTAEICQRLDLIFEHLRRTGPRWGAIPPGP